MLSPDAKSIEELAAILLPMGLTPIEARIQALLTLHPEPLSLDELVEALNVSKSSASVAARELERHGSLQRFSEPGSKRIRYGIMDRGGGFLVAQVNFLGAFGSALHKQARAAQSRKTAARLKRMGDFYLRVRDALEGAIEGE